MKGVDVTVTKELPRSRVYGETYGLSLPSYWTYVYHAYFPVWGVAAYEMFLHLRDVLIETSPEHQDIESFRQRGLI